MLMAFSDDEIQRGAVIAAVVIMRPVPRDDDFEFR
jgi:hypothetical protein